MQLQGRALGRGQDTRCPNNFVESLEAAMQSVGTIVNRQGIFFSIKSKLAARDTVAISAHQTAEKWIVREIIVQAIVAEHDIAHHAIPIGPFERNDNAAIRANARLQRLAVAQSEKSHRSAVLSAAKRFPADLRTS